MSYHSSSGRAIRVDVHEPESPELGFESHDAAGAIFDDEEDMGGLAWTIDREVGARMLGMLT